MVKAIKKMEFSDETGRVDIEYDDRSTNTFNMADVITGELNSSGGIDRILLGSVDVTGEFGAGGGSTNLSVNTSATNVVVVSNTGTDADIPSATTSSAGVFSAADKTKLNGIATAATANATDASLRDRSTHTGTQGIGCRFSLIFGNNRSCVISLRRKMNRKTTGS